MTKDYLPSSIEECLAQWLLDNDEQVTFKTLARKSKASFAQSRVWLETFYESHREELMPIFVNISKESIVLSDEKHGNKSLIWSLQKKPLKKGMAMMLSKSDSDNYQDLRSLKLENMPEVQRKRILPVNNAAVITINSTPIPDDKMKQDIKLKEDEMKKKEANKKKQVFKKEPIKKQPREVDASSTSVSKQNLKRIISDDESDDDDQDIKKVSNALVDPTLAEMMNEDINVKSNAKNDQIDEKVPSEKVDPIDRNKISLTEPNTKRKKIVKQVPYSFEENGYLITDVRTEVTWEDGTPVTPEDEETVKPAQITSKPVPVVMVKPKESSSAVTSKKSSKSVSGKKQSSLLTFFKKK